MSQERSTMLWNHWYTACASSRLRNAPRAVRVLDQDLVLFRDGAGVARALRDRCCHRGYRLSLGTVCGDRIECGFHGWQYASDGRCVSVPALCSGSRIPDAFRVPAFPVAEKDGYVWVWMSKDDRAPNYEPGIPCFAGRKWLQGSGDIACDAVRSIEINLDPAHIYYVHPSHPATQAFRAGGSVFQDSRQEVRVTDNGLVMFWPPSASPSDPVPQDAFRIYFELPNLVRFENAGDGMLLLIFLVPTGERSCRMEYLITQSVPTPRDVVWLDTVPEILEQDRGVLEVLQQQSDASPHAVERSVEADTAALLARKIIAMAQAGQWPAGRDALERVRIFESRSAGPGARRILSGTAA
jgi:phenylpropionate dioxygenase-like ring-hydroxylating dioxygenase large terminal subunit